MQKLLELQRAMQRHVLNGGDAVRSGGDAVRFGSEAVCAAIVQAPPLTVAERLEIYRLGYRARLLESLGELYPKLHALMGDAAFAAAAGQFVQSCPSVHRSIRWYGRELSEFLAQMPPFDGQPVLAELAQLEWAFAEVFDAADAVAISPEVLSALAPQHWGAMWFEFHPSVRMLTLRHGSMSIWQALSRGEACPPSPPAAGFGAGSGSGVGSVFGGAAQSSAAWLLWRRDCKNRYRSQTPAEATAIATALQGRSFARICAEIARLLPQDAVASCAAQCLATWADGGMITAVQFEHR